VKNGGQSGFNNYKHRIQKHKRPRCMPNPEMWKGCGPNILGFWDSGFGNYKCQTQTHNNFRIVKMRMEYGPSTSAFRGSGFRGLWTPSIQTKRNNICRIVKWKYALGPQFQGSGFANTRCKNKIHPELPNREIVIRLWDPSGFDVWECLIHKQHTTTITKSRNPIKLWGPGNIVSGFGREQINCTSL